MNAFEPRTGLARIRFSGRESFIWRRPPGLMKTDLLETFLGQLIQKVHGGAPGPQGLITYWKPF